MGVARDQLRDVLRVVARQPLIRRALRALGRGGWLPRSVWRRLPTDTPIVVELPSASFTWHVPEWVSRPVYWAGEIDEIETLTIWAELARSSSTIVDVGANLGLFSLVACAAHESAIVIAFEPVPASSHQLRASIAANGWERRCSVREVAIGDFTGIAPFHVGTDQFDSMASLDPSGFRGRAGTVVEVEVETLDHLIPASQRIDLVKIDIEKFEDAALRGMTAILARDQPTLVIECLPDGPFREVEGILTAYGYRLFHLRGDGPIAIEHIVPDPTEQWRNVLAAARSEVLLALADGSAMRTSRSR